MRLNSKGERVVTIPLLLRPFAAVACLVVFVGLAVIMTIGVLIGGKVTLKGL